MKTILCMTISLNGFIARENGDVDWTSEGTWKNYFNLLKKHKNVIIGKNTYEIMPEDEFVKDCSYFVMTKEINLVKKTPKLVFTNKKPKEVIELVKNKGFETIVVGGGGSINSAFLKENLIDEIIVDVEPKILGKGIKLFKEDNFESNLELIETKSLNENEIQLHYKVIK